MKLYTGLLLFILSFSALSCKAQKNTATQEDVVADRMLLYQLPNGGWPKHLTNGKAVNYGTPITDKLQKLMAKEVKYATIDNHATVREIEALAKAYKKTNKEAYKKAVERGVNYLLEAQYENGGFPQYYPDASSYRSQVTYNDNAMINALTVLNNVSKKEEDLDFLDEKVVAQAKRAVEKGLDCILRTQVLQGDSLSIWAAQYDNVTLKPAQARNFEPVSLSTSESVGIVRFLMKQPITPEIEKAVYAAIAWFERNDIEGYRFDKATDRETGEVTRDLIPDSTSTVWARFYDISNNKPLFGDRDQRVTYNFHDVSLERRNGYAWFGDWPANLIKGNYPNWLKKVAKLKQTK